MPNEKLIDREDSVSQRLHRKPRVKLVLDPTDVIPDKKKKYSQTYEEKIIKKKSETVQRVNPVSKITELMDCWSTENVTISSMYFPGTSGMCYLCSTDIEMAELVDCPICYIKVHKQCLVINEPLWTYKLDSSPWLCTKCRKRNCAKCLEDESQSDIAFRCLSCEVGLHTDCYESYATEQMHKIDDNLYVCVPCANLATQIHPIEKSDDDDDDDDDREDDVEPKPGTSGTVHARFSGDDSGSKIDSSCEMLHDELRYPSNNIPNITKWTKTQVLEYLSERLPREITDQIAKHDLDGRAILLLNRSDIVSTLMCLKLGSSLKFYREVRILQSQSTHHRVYWE